MDAGRREEVELQAEARGMDRIMDQTTRVRQAWKDADYGPIIEHQLDADLFDDLVRLFPNAAETLGGSGVSTFGELLFHPQPAEPALRLVKEFAKQLGENAWLAYPEEVANVLYYAAIAAAECHARTALTGLPREETLKGYRWAWARTWLPARLKELFAEALAEEA
jgi:hypothetical protein